MFENAFKTQNKNYVFDFVDARIVCYVYENLCVRHDK